MPPKDKFLSFVEVAELIGVSEGTIRNGECATSELPRIKLGGRVLFSLRAVEQWMARKAREAEEKKARARQAAVDFGAAKRRRQIAVRRRLLSIVNGGRSK